MRAMIVGSGGAREHALAWAFAKDGHEPICAHGNAGTAEIARDLRLDPEDPRAVVAACRELEPDLVVVGPEGPLAAGVVDALSDAGFPAFGPPRAAAALESSKSFARAFSERWGVPCAATARFSDAASFRRFLAQRRGDRLVLKKSGLAAGKGVLESDDPAELASFGESVLAGDELLVEEFLVGPELSVFAISDGRDYAVLPACADHKKAGAGDTGPNTGGMGAICPVPYADDAALARIEREIVEPTFRGMASEGLAYRGVLFFGIMMTDRGPKLLEYNVRFGDPETQSLLPLMETDAAELMAAAARGRLAAVKPAFSPGRACGVVVAAPGYPGPYPKGIEADLSAAAALSAGGSSLLFHASTSRGPDGTVRTGGGRCFTAVGLGDSWPEARDRAYAMAAAVRFEGAWFRADIGARAYGR
jgi:phosphoribosylamine---glycine ligase